jgi:hypothetical protein
MKVLRSPNRITIELSGAEARVLFEELSTIRGGSRMPKIRQVCGELEASFALGPIAKEGVRTT